LAVEIEPIPMIVIPFRRLAFGVLVTLLATRADAGSTLGPVPPPQDPAGLGQHIQRTMTRLSTSTPTHRNKVRILFYGQSITEQGWWKEVEADLRRRFPDADLEVENRAIGGFASPFLVKTAEHDIFAFYPDLIIFHVYGDHHKYEEIIRSIRGRTTAEIMMQTDHITGWPPATYDKNRDFSTYWGNHMNRVILPGIAAKYHCGLVDIQTTWLDYLHANKLEPKDLLRDEVHLNEHGMLLMGELIKRYLVVRPERTVDEGSGLIRTYKVGRDLAWKGGRLNLEFDGNRVEALAAGPSSPRGKARVRVDGKAPSEFPGAYAITRPTPAPWAALALIRVDHDRPLIAEDWTLTVESFTDKPARWAYRVAGSKTGPDGSGSSDATFVSKSGRVRIEPDSWFPNPKKPIEPGYQIQWSVMPMFVDSFRPTGAGDASLEDATTLIQGLPNGRHMLELVAEAGTPPAIAAIRVSRPPGVPIDERILYAAAATGGLVLAGGLTWGMTRRKAARRSRTEMEVGPSA
jgi:hypothetical protein